MPCKVAISLRVVNAQGYHDPRDALSQDWLPFLFACDIIPVLTPNLGVDVGDYIAAMDVGGILLTGGNNVCPATYGEFSAKPVSDTAPVRDQTEAAMIRYANETGLPVLGVCRGMQMLNAYYGGSILTSLKQQLPGVGEHVACQHEVEIISNRFATDFGEKTLCVNSFHDQGLTANELAPSLYIVAVTPGDGVVEALAHDTLPVVGIQWHPERQGSDSQFDRALMRKIFIDAAL